MAVIGRMKEIHKKIFMAGSILLFIVVVYYLTNSTDEGYQAYDVNTNVSDLRYLSSLGLTTSNDSYRNALTAYRENMGREFDPNDPTPTEPIGRRTNTLLPISLSINYVFNTRKRNPTTIVISTVKGQDDHQSRRI
jgi:hypothetical protein